MCEPKTRSLSDKEGPKRKSVDSGLKIFLGMSIIDILYKRLVCKNVSSLFLMTGGEMRGNS